MNGEDVLRRDRGQQIRNRTNRPRLGHKFERRAPTPSAVDLNEREVLTACEEPDPISGDGLVADGASQPVRERAQVVAMIHPRGV